MKSQNDKPRVVVRIEQRLSNPGRPKIFIGDTEITGHLSKFNMEQQVEQINVTPMTDGAPPKFVPGRRWISLDMSLEDVDVVYTADGKRLSNKTELMIAESEVRVMRFDQD